MHAKSLLALAVLLLSASASAQIVDDFEHGNEALYIQATAGDSMDIVAAAAHASNFGAQFAGSGSTGWRLRTDVSTAPGNVYQWYVRLRGSTSSGRSYTAFGATNTGGVGGVFAPNTATIIIQNNSGWGFSDLASAPFVPVADTWYLMRLDWALNGDMTLSIHDESGTTTLAATPTVATGFTTSGGLALRGFTTSAGAFNDVDTVEAGSGGGTPPVNYCTAKTTSNGCVPAIGFSGTPSPAGNYTVTCAQVEHGQLGVLFYGTGGQAAIAFQGGILCVNPPVIRLAVQGSGGAGLCQGTYSQGMTSVITALPAGTLVNCQYWFRDPGAASGTGLSNGNEFVTQ